MEANVRSRKTGLETLPVEQRQAILSLLPDAASLKSAVLTCSSLHHAFKGAEFLISDEIIHRQVDPDDVFPEAWAAVGSLYMQPRIKLHIYDFTDRHFKARRLPRDRFTLRDIVAMGELHFYVTHFAKDFAARMLDNNPQRPAINQAPVSQNELERIKRAFYRFETFCNLFHDAEQNSIGFQEIRRMFLRHFAPWENEQLASVHDYLFDVISTGFNEIATHDIRYGVLQVEYGDNRDNPYIQHLMSFGLANIYCIHMAKTYEARLEVLYCNFPRQNTNFLYEALDMNSFDIMDAIDDDVSHWIQDPQHHTKTPFFVDYDMGPFYLWRRAHNFQNSAYYLNTERRRPMRRQGYVMWDAARAATEYRILDWAGVDEHEVRHRKEQEKTKMKESWKQRNRLYHAVGMGWWNFGDESKVIWAESRKQGRDGQPTGRAHVEINSLEEAKDFLKQLKMG